MSVVATLKHSVQRITGKGKQVTGRATGHHDTEAKGSAEKSGADLKQAGENVKDALH